LESKREVESQKVETKNQGQKPGAALRWQARASFDFAQDSLCPYTISVSYISSFILFGERERREWLKSRLATAFM
jgi:hypothetical protein